MKNILFIHHAKGWGGAPINMINIINSLDKKKYKVKVLLIKDSIVREKLIENSISCSVAKSVFYRKFYKYYTHSEPENIKWYKVFVLIKQTILWVLSRYYFSIRELKNHDCDVIHLNSSVLTDWLAPASKKGKVIYHIQEPLTKGRFGLRYAFFRSIVVKYADKIIAISNDNAQRINIPEKTEIIFNYTEIPAKFSLGDSYKSKRVLYLGGANKIKGFFTLVQALDHLNKDVVVLFGGNYHLRPASKNVFIRFMKSFLRHNKRKEDAIRKINNHPNAHVIGLTHNVSKYLMEISCLVSPFSVSHFSRPIIESFLHKKPVIATNISGMDEIVEHNKNGIIVPPNNHLSLAKAINELTANEEKSKSMGQYGYNIAIKKYTSNNIKSFEKIYDSLQ